MLIDDAFLTDFRRLVLDKDGGARLQDKTWFYQKESSLLPLFQKLSDAHQHQVNLEWDPIVSDLVSKIPLDKQIKYSAALKHVEKGLKGHGSKMFVTLKNHGEKLSKSQQRFTIRLAERDGGDAGHGLCLQMALMWLRERFFFTFSTNFPRLANGNVVGSKTAVKTADAALALKGTGGQVPAQAALMGLAATARSWKTTFRRCHATLDNNADAAAVLIEFWQGQHAVAIYRESAAVFQFFDANAGAYRIQRNNLQAFLLDYNNTCLPNKWPGYALEDTEEFSAIYSIARG